MGPRTQQHFSTCSFVKLFSQQSLVICDIIQWTLRSSIFRFWCVCGFKSINVMGGHKYYKHSVYDTFPDYILILIVFLFDIHI